MGHGNHWECLGGTAEERVAQFIPLVCAKGKVGESIKRTAKWPGRKKAAAVFHALGFGDDGGKKLAVQIEV